MPNNPIVNADCVVISKDIYAQKKNDSEWIVIHSDGHMIISDTFDFVKSENNVIIAKKGTLFGAYALDGVCLLPCSCECIEVHKDAIVYKINNKYGLVSKTGNNICLPIYEQCRVLIFEDNLKETLERFMSDEAKTLYPMRNDSDEIHWLLEDYFPHDYIAKVQKNIEYYILKNESTSFVCNSTDGIICQIQYKVLSVLAPDALLVEENGKYGVYSLTDKQLIIDCYYDDIQYLGFAYGCATDCQQTSRYAGFFDEDEEKHGWKIAYWSLSYYDEKTNEWRNTADDCGVLYNDLLIIGRGIYCLYFRYEVKNVVPTVIQILNGRVICSSFYSWQFIDSDLCLDRPPYFLDKDLICVPVLQNFEFSDEMRRRRLSVRNAAEFEAIEEYLKYFNRDIKVTLYDKIIYDDYNDFNDFTIVQLVTWKKKKGVYALVGDNKWSRILDYKYNDIQLRKDGNFDVRINDAWGIVSKSGIEILGVKYSKKVNSIYVQDANTKLSGVLNNDFTCEIIPTVYDSIVFDNQIGVNRDFYYNESYCIDDYYLGDDYEKPIAVEKCEMIVSEGKIDYREAEFAVLTDELIPMTDYIYSRVRVRGNFIIAYGKRVDGITHELSNVKYTVYDIVDVYYRDTREKKCSFNDAYVCTTDNPDLFVIIHKLSNSQITKAYMCSFEDEGGWKTLDYDWVTAVNDNWFIVKNYAEMERKPMSARYGVVDRNGKGTNIEYMFMSAPVNGWFFAVKELEIKQEKSKKRDPFCRNQFDDSRYNVYLFNVENISEEKKLLVFESVDINVLLKLVDSKMIAHQCNKNHILFKKATPEYLALYKELACELTDIITCKWESEILDCFIEYIEYNEYNEDDGSYSGRDDWDYERDSWYAMTDGQYGDYPGSSAADDFYEGSGW